MKKREICIGGKFGKYFYCPESPYILWNHKLRCVEAESGAESAADEVVVAEYAADLVGRADRDAMTTGQSSTSSACRSARRTTSDCEKRKKL